MLKIFIPEIIPSLNKGEEAIFRGILKTLDGLGEYEVSLFSAHPEIDTPRYNLPNVRIISGDSPIVYSSSKAVKFLKFPRVVLKHIAFLILLKLLGKGALRIMPGDVWRAYQAADIIIVGHDNAFSKFHIPLILFCNLLNKPSVIYGASMLPWVHASPLNRKLVKFCLERVDLITLREEISKQLLDEIGLRNPSVYVTADKAFLLDPAPAESVGEIMAKEGISKKAGEILVGFTAVYGSEVFTYAFPEIKDHEKKYEKHVEILASLVDDLIETLNATVVFIPHAIGFGGFEDKFDDRLVARNIYKKVRNKQKVITMENEYSVTELKGIIAQCDLFVGERTHSVIGAMSMGVPSVVITSPKDYRTQGIIGRMLNQQKWVYNCEEMRADTLIAKVHELWEQRDQVHLDLLQQAAEAKRRSLMNGELLKQLVEKKLAIGLGQDCKQLMHEV